jgi:hypothetical protein
MSVIHFDADELGNLAAFLVSRWGGSDEEQVAEWAKSLAVIAKANVAAYKTTYSDAQDAKAVPAAEIAAFAKEHIGRVSAERALSTAQLLDYNCVANSGVRKCPPSYWEALAYVMKAALSRCADRLPGAA